MKTYRYETSTDVSPDSLYAALAEINQWAHWDDDIEWTKHEGDIVPGATFTLKPKGGPKVAMQIVEAKPGSTFVDMARLPLAKMHTSHIFLAQGDRTKVTISITVSGILGFVWDRIVARKQAAGSAEQTRRLIAFAAGRS